VSYLIVALTGALLLGVGAAGSVLVVGVLFFVQGVGFGVLGVIWSSSVARWVDERLRGRVISIDSLGSAGLMPFSSALAGAAAGALGAGGLFAAGGVAVLACASVGLASKRARDFGPAPAPGGPLP
jgi:hypothetical protein